MAYCLTRDDEKIVEEVVESARALADQSEDEADATAKINNLPKVKIINLVPNKTGSFTFHLLINLNGGDRTKNVTITKRFNR